jgi:hypothetical protein
MAKYERNANKHWTPTEVKELKELAKENTPTRVIGLKLGRPVNGVESKAQRESISLAPTNQRPYNRRQSK